MMGEAKKGTKGRTRRDTSPATPSARVLREADIRALHHALNDLLALFWTEANEMGYSATEKALNALARRPDLPITVAFAADVRERARRLNRRRQLRRRGPSHGDTK